MKTKTINSFSSSVPNLNKAKHSVSLWSLLLIPLLFSCLNDQQMEPEIIVDPQFNSLIGTDTIRSGDYKTFTIGTTSQSTYEAVNQLKGDIGLEYLNIVSNIYTGMEELEDKLPLYHYIFMDEKKGTSSGVQLGIKEDRIATIFLGSGKELDKWPSDLSHSAIRKGDDVAVLYEKLKTISENNKYKNKFEAINLLTKDLSKLYDPQMGNSPQWYFAYTLEKNKMDVVKLNFKEGALENIIVNHFQTH